MGTTACSAATATTPLAGGDGNDTLQFGGDGDDSLEGRQRQRPLERRRRRRRRQRPGRQRQRCSAATGSDILGGRQTVTTLRTDGGNGNDLLFGGNGDDSLLWRRR